MLHDLKFAWRALHHRPWTTLAAVLCLGIGIGANTALFAALDALLYRPPPGMAAANEVVRVRIGQAGGPTPVTLSNTGPTASYVQMQRIAEQLRQFADVAAYGGRDVTFGSGERAAQLKGLVVTANYFDVLGVRPYRGRFFAPEDNVPGATPVAVLSHRAWRGLSASRTDVVGATLTLNNFPVTVIGVAPPSFTGVDLDQRDIWLAMGAAGHAAFGGPGQYSDATFWLQLVARRHEGVSEGAFTQAVRGDMRDPNAATPYIPTHTIPLRAMFFSEHGGKNPVPPWTIAITLSVLLLACASVANLLLAQGAAREREIAVRLALGAPRLRILRQLLLENVLIALASAIAAIALASLGKELLRVLPVPPIAQLIDMRAGLFTFIVAMVTTLLFGLVPAWGTARGDLDAVLRRGATRGSARESRMQQTLTSAQIAVSFTLLVGAALFVTSFRNVLRIDTGFALDRLIEVSVSLAGSGLAGDDARHLVEQMEERARAVPGVVAAAAGGRIVPFYFYRRISFAIPDGRALDMHPVSHLTTDVGVEYFNAMDIRIAAGRAFDPTDRAMTEPVAVISGEMARRFWPEGNALGSCIQMRARHGDACVRVVGITAAFTYKGLTSREPTSVLFLLDAQDRAVTAANRTVTMFVRTATDPRRVLTPLRNQLQSMHPGMPFVHVRRLDDRARPARIQWEIAATLFTVFGLLATLIAALGLYMVVAFMVAQHTRELGIRSALGSSRGAIIRLVLTRSTRISAAGIIAGTACALGGARLLASRLYGVAATDVAVYVAAAVLLLIVTLVASWMPARAASRQDPLAVLRHE